MKNKNLSLAIILINTLGASPREIMPYDEDRSIDLSFACDTVVGRGVQVKMKTDGTVTPITAVTDIPFGVVEVGNRVINEKVTVKTYFVAVVRAIADGTVDEGQRLACSGVDATTGFTKGKVAVTSNYVSGIALTGTTTGLECRIGILRTPFLI